MSETRLQSIVRDIDSPSTNRSASGISVTSSSPSVASLGVATSTGWGIVGKFAPMIFARSLMVPWRFNSTLPSASFSGSMSIPSSCSLICSIICFMRLASISIPMSLNIFTRCSTICSSQSSPPAVNRSSVIVLHHLVTIGCIVGIACHI